MWVFRVGFCYVMVLGFHGRLLSIWMGMFLDWVFRSLCFFVRLHGAGGWNRALSDPLCFPSRCTLCGVRAVFLFCPVQENAALDRIVVRRFFWVPILRRFYK